MRRTTRVLVGLDRCRNAAARRLRLRLVVRRTELGLADCSPSASGAVTPTDGPATPCRRCPAPSVTSRRSPSARRPAPDRSCSGKVLSEGTGRRSKSGQLLAVDYLGQVYGGKVFDNSYDRKPARGVRDRAGQVIAGWDDTLVGMKAGSRVLISVPPARATARRASRTPGSRAPTPSCSSSTSSSPSARTSPGRPTQGRRPAPAGFTVGGELGKVPTVERRRRDGQAEKASDHGAGQGQRSPAPGRARRLPVRRRRLDRTRRSSRPGRRPPAGAPVSKDGKTRSSTPSSGSRSAAGCCCSCRRVQRRPVRGGRRHHRPRADRQAVADEVVVVPGRPSASARPGGSRGA